jgi:hypothetical protein
LKIIQTNKQRYRPGELSDSPDRGAKRQDRETKRPSWKKIQIREKRPEGEAKKQVWKDNRTY